MAAFDRYERIGLEGALMIGVLISAAELRDPVEGGVKERAGVFFEACGFELGKVSAFDSISNAISSMACRMSSLTVELGDVFFSGREGGWRLG